MQLFLLLCLFSTTHVIAHVVLNDPPPRKDDNYVYTFDGSCQDDSCDSFCGDSYPYGTGEVTTVEAGSQLDITFSVDVTHQPYRHRFSLSPGPKDSQFDSHVLTEVQLDSTSGSHTVTVTIPDRPDCAKKPCVLQLWDFYYFVSCANLLITGSRDGPIPTQLPSKRPPIQPVNTPAPTIADDTLVQNCPKLAGAFKIGKDLTFSIEIEENGMTATMTSTHSWFGVGLGDSMFGSDVWMSTSGDPQWRPFGDYHVVSKSIPGVLYDAKQDLITIQHTEKDGLTTVIFARMLVTGDVNDLPIVCHERKFPMVWAFGDGRVDYHNQNRGVKIVKLEEVDDDTKDTDCGVVGKFKKKQKLGAELSEEKAFCACDCLDVCTWVGAGAFSWEINKKNRCRCFESAKGVKKKEKNAKLVVGIID